MRKGIKIKRYSQNNNFSYNKNNRSPFKIIAAILIICILAFIGWSAYTPVYDFVMSLKDNSVKTNAEKPIQSSQQSSSNENTVSDSSQNEVISSSQAISSNAQSSQTSDDTNTITEPENIKAIFIPTNILTDTIKITEFLDSIAKNGHNINTVMIDIKEQNGLINIPTENKIAVSSSAVSKNTENVVASIKIIKEKGFKILGRVAAFKDPLAPSALSSSRISYMNTDYAWFDKSPANGGKQWLNPYSTDAQNYIISIADDAIAQGVDYILFDCVQFPYGEALEQAYYGVISANKSRMNVLKEFVNNANSHFNDKNINCYYYTTVYNYLNPNNYIFGGNQLDIYSSNTAISLMLSQFGSTMKFNDTNYSNNFNEPEKSVDTMLLNIDDKIDKTTSIGLLQGYKNDYELMSSDEIEKQISVLKSHNILNFIIYNPAGAYN